MRCAVVVAWLGGFAALAPLLGVSAQPPKPTEKEGALLKAVTPPGGQTRVRVPVAEGMTKAIQMKIQVPNPKAKKGGGPKKDPIPSEGTSALDAPGKEFTRGTAALNTLNRNYITGKMLERWGYTVPMAPTFVLPELFIEAEQLSPKPSGKSSGVLIRVPNLKFELVEEAPDGGAQIFGADMIIFLPDFVQSAGSRPPEPRFHFPERFFDLSVPPAALRKADLAITYEPPAVEPSEANAPAPVAVACPLAFTPGLCFTGAAINGIDTFPMPDGKTHAVTPLLSSCTYGGSGIIMNIGMARALKLDVDLTKDAAVGMSTAKRLRLIEYTVRELRLGTLTGPGLKTPRDLVFENVPIWIEVTDSEPMLWIGYPFLVKHFKDSVLAYTADGKAALHGRVNPDLIRDVRPKKK